MATTTTAQVHCSARLRPTVRPESRRLFTYTSHGKTDTFFSHSQALCVGPRVTGRQKVFVGVDAFAVAVTSDAVSGPESCFNGKNTLETVFNDWDYNGGVKNECTLGKPGVAFGAGGYYQIPKTTLDVTVAQKTNAGMASSYTIVHDFQV